jgi:hypothetical protein
LEETHRNPEIQIPQPIQAIFPNQHRRDDGYGGGTNWVYDKCVSEIDLPMGFDRNNYNQTLPPKLWVDIETIFFQAQQNCLNDFVNFD